MGYEVGSIGVNARAMLLHMYVGRLLPSWCWGRGVGGVQRFWVWVVYTEDWYLRTTYIL